MHYTCSCAARAPTSRPAGRPGGLRPRISGRRPGRPSRDRRRAAPEPPAASWRKTLCRIETLGEAGQEVGRHPDVANDDVLVAFLGPRAVAQH